MTDRRTPHSTPAGKLAAEIAATGTPVASVATAAGLAVDDFQSFLSGTTDIEVEQLVRAGGFLSLSPNDLFAGVAA